MNVGRYGPGWWALYAAAWHSRWPAVRNGVGVQEKDGTFSRVPVDPKAVAIMAAQDADEGIAAFNGAFGHDVEEE
jgi:hypothetical protein